MEAAKAKELAKAFVRGFYLQGNLYGLINADTTDPNLIGFATQSAQYARGRDAVLHILQREYALIAPCRLFRARFHVHLAPREFSVTCLLVLRTAQSSSMILHRLILMYRLADEGTPVLRGIHLTRSYHHESTYRAFSAPSSPVIEQRSPRPRKRWFPCLPSQRLSLTA